MLSEWLDCIVSNPGGDAFVSFVAIEQQAAVRRGHQLGFENAPLDCLPSRSKRDIAAGRKYQALAWRHFDAASGRGRYRFE